MSPAALIAAALGKPLWTTDAFMPRYRAGEHGNWRIHPGGAVAHDWGYHSGPCVVEMLPSLARKVAGSAGAWDTWMSLTPHEIESQELGYRHAHGHTVIMGLGMGWIAANGALNPRVTQVTIVERDPDVISLFRDSGAFDSLPAPAQAKIAIAQADALEWRPGAVPVDFLYADIWLSLAEPHTIGQVRRMQEHAKASQVYFWGQEIAIHSAIRRLAGGMDDAAITPDAIGRAVDEVIALPLLVPQDIDYARMVEQVIANRIARRLPIAMDT